MLFLMAAIALFVPSVMAAEAPTYDEENKHFLLMVHLLLLKLEQMALLVL